MLTTYTWTAKWIASTAGWIDTGRDKRTEHHSYSLPAPYLRKRFSITERPKNAMVYLCSAGWHELYVNGHKADDRVLTPCVSQFDVHVNYLTYDITNLLQNGDNAITVMLGNGLFNANTSEVWNFNHASWRDYPRMICELVADGNVILRSGDDWKRANSPIVFDSMRSGEDYDFSQEIAGVFEADFDDSSWQNAFQVRPPAGQPILETMEPCRICKTIQPVAVSALDATTAAYDFGVSLTGWAELEVEVLEDLSEPLEITLSFLEVLHEGGSVAPKHIGCFAIDGWEHQKVHLKLAPGQRTAVWRPHFTYFGYRYMVMTCQKLAAVKMTKCQALFIHNDFAALGKLSSSNETLNSLQEVTMRSFLTNFTGIPTDCPHREKNGWTGDHSLAMATALWNYDAKDAYKNFLQIFADTQRPSGELAPIAPDASWWWNCGPGWDYVLFQGAWDFHRFYGDDEVIFEKYDVMRKYLEFTEMMSKDGICSYGLGDWCRPKDVPMATTRLTSSAWVMSMWERFAIFADMTGHQEDVCWAQEHAVKIREALRKEFIKPGEPIDHDIWSSLGCILYFHICAPEEEAAIAKHLVELVRAAGHTCRFGIFGAKWVPRVLAEHGYAEDALQLFLQPEYPGYAAMLKQGATTLWESFEGSCSLDHIMYGDLSAWFYEYLGGIQPRFDGPGFSKFDLKPTIVPQLTAFQSERTLGKDRIVRAAWKVEERKVLYAVTVPEGSEATLYIPGKEPQVLRTGMYNFVWNL